MKILKKISTAFLTLVLRNSDNSWNVTIPTTADYTVPDITVYSKDANGQPVATPYPAAKDYTEVGSIPDANGWIRPADWLPISHLVTDGEEKAVALYAVWDAAGIAQGYNNYCAILCRGAYTVDWGDGTVDNVADNVQAEHTYVYANLPASSYCSRGYRQAIITITPQAGQHLTSLQFTARHTLSIGYRNYLDIRISGTHIQSIYLAYLEMLEAMYVYQSTTAFNTLANFLTGCRVLQSINVLGLNFNVTSLSVFSLGCMSVKRLDISTINTTNITSFSTGLYYMHTLQEVVLPSFVNPKVNFDNLLNSAHLLKHIKLSAPNGCTSIYALLRYTYRLVSADFSELFTDDCVDLSYMFQQSGIQEIDFSHTTLAAAKINFHITTDATNVKKCRLPQIGRSFSVANAKLDAPNLNLLFGDVRDLNGSIDTLTINAGGTGYAVNDMIQIDGGNNDARIKVLTIGTGGSVATYRLMIAGTGYSVASGLATSNITGTGSGFKVNVTALVAPQTLTYTGNTGAATCDPSILTAKNWIGVG